MLKPSPRSERAAAAIEVRVRALDIPTVSSTQNSSPPMR